MNEAGITSQLLAFLRQHLRGPILKHADKVTLGMPDVSITSGGTTQWVELKLVKVGKRKRLFNLKKIVGFGGPQYRLMGQLDLHGHALYIIFFTDGKDWWMMLSTAVAMANACNINHLVDITGFIPGKRFEDILTLLKTNMSEDRL